MNDNVIGLKGLAPLARLGEPVPNVVDRCREMLSMAERGELRGLIVAYFITPGKPRFNWSYDNTDATANGLSTALLGATAGWAGEGVTMLHDSPEAG